MSHWGFVQKLKELVKQLDLVQSHIDLDPHYYKRGGLNMISREISELKEDIQIYLEEK